ncbi:MAG: hypothetical protein PHX20_01985 [Candidatus Omnitrophica bacterium]|nr:hypothetical protein [Candidatus Omnitrophota bacterium]MDD5436291.1 hypothetical protein [Candidatus Omnitrophota bacterium]
MDKKRPAGVTIFSWVIIIGTVLSAMSLAEAQKVNPPLSNYFYFIILPASFIMAVYLLKLKNWARVGVIVIAILVSAETLITAPSAIKKGSEVYSAQFEQEFNDAAKAAAEKKGYKPAQVDMARLKEAVKKSINVIMVISITIALLFNLAVIMYFIHPKVKAQFIT